MASKTINAKIKQRIDTTANWDTNSSVVLENGEMGFERTTSGEIKFKIGDGQKTWSQLSYVITNNANLNNQSLKVLKEKHSIDTVYTSRDDVFPNQTVSVYENSSLTTAEATEIINFIENENSSYYLNSSDIPLEKLIFSDPTTVGLNQDDECYSLYYNFDISIFQPVDNTKPYYILNIIYKNDYDMYILQCITSLTTQDAPTKWIIYELLDDEVIIENTMTQNSNNLLTNKAIYDALSNLPSGSGNGNSGNSNEIYIGTTEPTGYKMWIDPTEDASGALESIPIVYVDFTLTTNNGEETLTTSYDFDDVETEVEANSVVIARITSGDQTLYAQLLERKEIGSTPLDTFLFGVATNNSYKIFTINENDVCAVSTMALGGGGASFELEQDGNMLLEDGVLKARYGEPTYELGKIFKLSELLDIEIDDSSLTFADAVMVQGFNLWDSNLLPLEGQASVELIYEDGSTNTMNLTMENIPTSYGIEGCTGGVGMETIMATMLSDGEDQNALSDWIAHKDTYQGMACVKQDNNGTDIFIVMLFLPESLSTKNGEDIEDATVFGLIERGYPIPAAALRAGNGISINSTTNEIGLKYGTKKGEDLNINFAIDNNAIDNTIFANSLYGWYCSYNSLLRYNPSQGPQAFSSSDSLKFNRYKEGKITEEMQKISLPISYNSTIDYEDDTYYSIPFYYITNEDIEDTNLSSDSLIDCKELQYTDNILYTAFSAGLDSSNPSNNIFYAGTYNTTDSINTIFTNASITPTDNSKPALAVVLLHQTITNIWYFTVFSNVYNLEMSDKGDSNYKLIQASMFDEYNYLPTNLMNKNSKIEIKGNGQVFVLGEQNIVATDDNSQLVIGDNNVIQNTQYPGLYVGNNLNIGSNTYCTIKPDQYGIEIKTDGIYINNNRFGQSCTQSINSSLDSNASTSDIINAYNTLLTNYGNLQMALANTGIINITN